MAARYTEPKAVNMEMDNVATFQKNFTYDRRNLNFIYFTKVASPRSPLPPPFKRTKDILVHLLTWPQNIKQTLTEIKVELVDFSIFFSVYNRTSQDINKGIEYLHIMTNNLDLVTVNFNNITARYFTSKNKLFLSLFRNSERNSDSIEAS